MESVEVKIPIRELIDCFVDKKEEGVVGYGGRLNIRPAYQREFIYNDKQRDAVIDTIMNDLPISSMHWAGNFDNNGDIDVEGHFELLDGQQRTLSICKYANGDFTFNGYGFQNLPRDLKEKFLNYKVHIFKYFGTESQKLKWFKTINIAGEKLTTQELRNAVYVGSWIEDAKRYFSKPQCVAYKLGEDYMKGSPIRQEYLETAIKWVSEGDIEGYMSKHQHDPNASHLWRYFQDVLTWVESVFPKKYNEKRKKLMKGVDWGFLYNRFKDEVYNVDTIEKELHNLILDDDVTNNKGVYPYLLTRDLKHLSIRAFTNSMKLSVYEKQKGVCPSCGGKFLITEMEADHITPWHEGGKTIEDNCQMLCKQCNRTKSGK